MAAIFFARRGTSTKVVMNTPRTNETATLLAVADRTLVADSDSDGLPDWEETLRKTDPNNPDSDRDGIKDGDEKFEDTTISAHVKETAQQLNTEGLTSTEKLGRQLLLQYLEYKKQGKTFDQAALAKFTENMLTGVNADAEVKLYSIGDIQVLADNSATAFREYANRMGRIILRNSSSNPEGEVAILSRALENNDHEEIKKIVPIRESFSNSLEEGLTVPVPKDLAALHLALLNSFVYMKATLGSLELVFEDPLVAYVRITQHGQSINAVKTAVQNISIFYKNSNIRFTPEEEGAALVNIM